MILDELNKARTSKHIEKCIKINPAKVLIPDLKKYFLKIMNYDYKYLS
jgi:hypothetical protein